jgi:hypothetical protein
MYQARRFTEAGIKEYRTRLKKMTKEKHFIELDDLLFSDELTQIVSKNPIIEVCNLERYELSIYLDSVIQQIFSEERNNNLTKNDAGLWNWISALWGENLFENTKGKFFVARNEKSLDRHLLAKESWRDYRHLLYGNWLVASTLNCEAKLMKPFMFGHPTAANDVFEQIVSRREILASKTALTVIRDLYVAPGSTAILNTVARANVPGGLRRFGSLFSQLATKFDLHGMDKKELKTLLPLEFHRWIDGAAHQQPLFD